MSSENCIFCKIVAGEIPAAKIVETEEVLAFLDIVPINPGHVLVIPRQHFETIWDIPSDIAQTLTWAIRKISKAVMAATKADGLNIGMNNLKAAGQLVPHAHVHLIPRFDGDGLDHWVGKAYKDVEEMNLVAAAVRSALG
jgi:histidine triad (HIT) family protein